jgi:hypothetical protein
MPSASWLEVPAGQCVPFWPISTDSEKTMVARIKGTMLETLPFDITQAHTTLLQLYHDVISRSVSVSLLLNIQNELLHANALIHFLWLRVKHGIVLFSSFIRCKNTIFPLSHVAY